MQSFSQTSPNSSTYGNSSQSGNTAPPLKSTSRAGPIERTHSEFRISRVASHHRSPRKSACCCFSTRMPRNQQIGIATISSCCAPDTFARVPRHCPSSATIPDAFHDANNYLNNFLHWLSGRKVPKFGKNMELGKISGFLDGLGRGWWGWRWSDRQAGRQQAKPQPAPIWL